MGILGIDNRTENWKTAQTFAPFIGNDFAAKLLAERLLEGRPLDPEEEVSLELFWKGGRDYWHAAKKCDKLVEPSPKLLACTYNQRFPRLRKEIEEFQRDAPKAFRPLLLYNYKVDNVDGGYAKTLATNFRNTEFDIVLETSEYLLIGEAKDESSFDAKSKYVLVHQLIRQYVIAEILVHLVAEAKNQRPKKVVPFVVAPRGKKLESLMETAQIRFMTGYPKGRPYLKKSNILSWGS